ncbi:MAG: Stp1/IreP family PP2C-type Ser/Thr phosphatase [Oscillospiraceae bacterium]|nr:Stp1/IreP family PP2C-type Ser/Thr phosphatase [Oscillospiraceae bacterium]
MQYWASTDLGAVRTQNQDAYQVEKLDKNTILCVVCDGMGGAKAGNVASTLAADVFIKEVKRAWSSDLTGDRLEQMLRGAVKLANFTVYDQAQQVADYSGMGTTLVAALIRGKKATVVNVGDSRAYFITADGIRQITMDHSLVQMMIDRGELTPEKAKRYPGKNLITRAIGTEEQVQCDVFNLNVGKETYILMCTDGLSNLMDDQEILFEIAHSQDRENCCERLLDIVKKRGAPDNVTSVLVAL